MSLPTMLPAWVVPILPIAVSAVIGIFEHPDPKHPYAPLINVLISTLFFLLGTLIIFISIGPITYNLNFDVLLYLTLFSLLLASPPCKVLYETLVTAIPSPLKVLFDLLDKSMVPEETKETEKPVATLTKIDGDVHGQSTLPEHPTTTLPPLNQ